MRGEGGKWLEECLLFHPSPLLLFDRHPPARYKFLFSPQPSAAVKKNISVQFISFPVAGEKSSFLFLLLFRILVVILIFSSFLPSHFDKSWKWRMLVHQLIQLFVKCGNNLEGSLTAGDDSHVSSDNFCKNICR